jgi:hypothetical protein
VQSAVPGRSRDDAVDGWPGAFAAAVLVCTSPRATIRTIVATEPRRHVVPLVLMTGLAGLFAPERPQLFSPVGLVLVLLLAVPTVWIFGRIFASVGRFLGGTGDAVAVRAGMAWSGVPAILAFLVRLALLLVVGREALLDGFGARVTGLFNGFIGLWVWALDVIMLSEVHRFSLGRALLTTFLGSLVFALPVVLLVAIGVASAMLGLDVAPGLLRLN